MDYGQTPQMNAEQPFFPEAINESAQENNLDLTNEATSWGGAEGTPTRDQSQNFGKNAINGQFVENIAEGPSIAPDFGPSQEILGQISETELAPETGMNSQALPEIDQKVFKNRGDSLSGEAVSTIEKMEKMLDSDGDAAKFVNQITAVRFAYKKANNIPGAA